MSYGSTGEVEHCHGGSSGNSVDYKARRKLIIASILCLLFMVAEIIGGALAGSLAIMTDAAHLLTDFASFLISLVALFLASRPATKRMSFGWHRAEIVGALISVLMIWVVTAILVYLATKRILSDDYTIDATVMLITSAVGVGVNIIMAASLHQHSHSHGGGGGGGGGHSHGQSNQNSPTTEHGHGHIEQGHGHGHSHGSGGQEEKVNINVRAAFIHVIGDFIQSLGVLAASLIIYFKPEYKMADPICTFIFSVLVLFTTIAILRDTMHVLMEGAPKNLNFNQVKQALYDIPGVVEVHNLRMWSLTTTKSAVSVHLAFDQTQNPQSILKKANQILRHDFFVHDSTIQMEAYVPQMANCEACRDPKD